MLCCGSSRFWQSPVIMAVFVVGALGFLATVGALPAGHRDDSSTTPTDNGVRQSHSPRQRHRTSDPKRILCGPALRQELASVCDGRGYNGMFSGPSRGYGETGAADSCCEHPGCSRRDLDSYCNPRINGPAVPESTEEVVSASASYEVINPQTSLNQLQTNPVQEEPKSVASSQIDAETENALYIESKLHKYYVKTNDMHKTNRPVTTRRQSTIH